MKITHLTSVGLDIGTCTTKFVLSRLTVAERGAAAAIAHDEITQREVLYTSPMYRTPLLDEVTLDAPALSRFLASQLQAAGVQIAEVGSGAVIMTGETATKQNAEDLLHELAEQAGTFVVATAGHDLEAIMAGRGSGAAERSLSLQHTVANIDIGGGTANVAWFRKGNPVATVTFHLGGSLIRLLPDGTITYVSPAVQAWLSHTGSAISEGQMLPFERIREITQLLARTITGALAGCMEEPIRSGVDILTIGQRLTETIDTDEWMISGGVANLIGEPAPLDLEAVSRYRDVGPLLAHAFYIACTEHGFKLVPAEHTWRATVIGAGLQTIELSGSTIHVDADTLPLRNVPVMPCKVRSLEAFDEDLKQLFAKAIQLYGLTGKAPFALALQTEHPLSYLQVREVARQMSLQLQTHFSRDQTAVVICDQDMAQALGQLLSLGCQSQPRIICVDGIGMSGIGLRLGDYLDLGELIANRTVPAIVKTLVFPNVSTEVIS